MNEACFVLDRHAVRIFNVLAHECNSPQEDVPFYTDTLFWLWADQTLLLPVNAAGLVEKQQITNLMSLVWPGRWSNPRPSIYHRGSPVEMTSKTSCVLICYSYNEFRNNFDENIWYCVLFTAQCLCNHNNMYKWPGLDNLTNNMIKIGMFTWFHAYKNCLMPVCQVEITLVNGLKGV